MATSTTSLAAGSASLGIEDDLKCGTCLELFQDPRSLPCLHTFCLECIKRTINGSNTFKCPLCRAVHKLSEEKAELLPVDQYAVLVQELLRTSQQSETTSMRKCQSCGEQTSIIEAWCAECEGVICQQCVTLHKKLAPLRGHSVVEKKENGSEDSSVKDSKTLSCPKHAGENLKYLCTECSELVCSECYMTTHKYHTYSTAEEAQHNFEELATLAVTKKEEFNDYLKRVKIVEDKAIEYTEQLKSAVNKTFDAIAASAVASVEEQRSETLQSVSAVVKKIRSQKDMMEVRIAQVDSFIRFADQARKCTTSTSTSYVAMATQAFKLIKQLKDAHVDEDTLDYKMVAIGAQSGENLHLSVPLDGVVKLGQPTLEFTPASGSLTMSPQGCVSITVSLMVQGLSIVLPTPHEGYNLDVEAKRNGSTVCTSVNLLQSQGLSWEIVAQLSSTEAYCSNKLTICCSMAGNMEIKPSEKTYTIEKTIPKLLPSPSHSDSESLIVDFSDLTLQQLTSLAPHQQKQLIGDHIYRKIYGRMYPQLSGKITGTVVTRDVMLHLEGCLIFLPLKVNRPEHIIPQISPNYSIQNVSLF